MTGGTAWAYGASAWASARIAVPALRVNKLRSALPMLGIVIGVGAVITMVAVGAGAQARVAEQIQSLGSNLIIVVSGSALAGGVRMGSGSQLTITEDDAWAIQGEITAVAAAAPASRGGAQVVHGNLNWATGIQGVTLEFFTTREWDVADGRLFTQEEVDEAGKVALLGQTVAGNLFADGDPLCDPDQERALHGHRPARAQCGWPAGGTSVTLSLIGGAIGVTVGLAGSSAVAYFARWRTLVSTEAVVVAFGFAAAVGVFFGFYPARKAAALDPIDALRYE